MKVGFLGMSHLGQVYSTATANRGISVIQFDNDADLIDELKRSGPSVAEYGLNEIWNATTANRNLTTQLASLDECDLLFVVSDVTTDEGGTSDLKKVRQLTELAISIASSQCPVVIRSQVPPGFTREYSGRGCQVLYHVETLVFSEAVSRATKPDRHIVGVESRDTPLPQTFQKWLEVFAAPTHVMTFESAELAKIAINLYLAATVSTTNSLAELCENLGAEWSQIVPALQDDPRIGKYAYLKPGLGISGGNLERDLASFCALASRYNVNDVVMASIIAHSQFRRGMISRLLAKEKTSIERPIGILGLSYKPGTASIKNSPSIDLIQEHPHHRFIVHDPVVKISRLRNVKQVPTMQEVMASCDILLIMTPWTDYVGELNSHSDWLRNLVSVIDPYAVVSLDTLRNFVGNYRRLGSSDK